MERDGAIGVVDSQRTVEGVVMIGTVNVEVVENVLFVVKLRDGSNHGQIL